MMCRTSMLCAPLKHWLGVVVRFRGDDMFGGEARGLHASIASMHLQHLVEGFQPSRNLPDSGSAISAAALTNRGSGNASCTWPSAPPNRPNRPTRQQALKPQSATRSFLSADARIMANLPQLKSECPLTLVAPFLPLH